MQIRRIDLAVTDPWQTVEQEAVSGDFSGGEWCLKWEIAISQSLIIIETYAMLG